MTPALTPATQRALALALETLMSEISEANYAAGWMLGLEYGLWALVKDQRLSGRGYFIGAERLEALTELSRFAGGWHDGDGFVPLDVWEPRFAVEEERWKAAARKRAEITGEQP